MISKQTRLDAESEDSALRSREHWAPFKVSILSNRPYSSPPKFSTVFHDESSITVLDQDLFEGAFPMEGF